MRTVGQKESRIIKATITNQYPTKPAAWKEVSWPDMKTVLENSCRYVRN